MAKPESKAFYSCLDLTISRIAPQFVQHLVIAQFAEQRAGHVTFYTGENSHTRYTHEVILGKIKERPKVVGIIFYRLAQFLGPHGAALEAMRAILDAGYELHFAVDKLSLLTPPDLDAFYPMLRATALSESRDLDRAYFEPLLRPEA